jgi:murein L,D-transpeptidase YafK
MRVADVWTSQRGSKLFGIFVVLLAVVLCAPAWPKNVKAAGQPQVDRIVIVKSEHTMTLLRQGKVLKTYRVALGGQPVGAKTRRGDNKTPEGLYTIDSRNPGSHYHLALHISYPNAADRERAKREHLDPGGAIMIHGLPKGYGWIGARHRLEDWTLGCVAVTDEEIDEIWAMVPLGTVVEIKP